MGTEDEEEESKYARWAKIWDCTRRMTQDGYNEELAEAWCEHFYSD